MMPELSSDRRAFLKWVAALPLLGQIAAQDMFGKARAGINKVAGRRIPTYEGLGVRTLINGRGTWTYLSASLELPEVKEAQLEAAKHFVDIIELQHAVGRRLAELSGAESGMVTSGAAGAMASATAGCIAGTDPQKIWQLPDTTGMKDQVIMFGGRNAFDSAIRLAGGKLVIANSLEELQNSINDKTAMVYTTVIGDRLEKALAITKRAGVPLLLDDAAGIPPISNLRLYAKMGCDLYTFSGGKGLLGPQCSGLLLGRKDLIEAALANTNPWEGAVCRPMKVGKEEIMGCLAAVEAWLKMDTDSLYRQWNARVQRIAKLVETVPGVTTNIYIPQDGNRYPTLRVLWDQQAWNFSVEDCAKQLRDGKPRIEVLTASNPSGVLARLQKDFLDPREENRLEIVSMSLQPGEDLIVGRRLREVLMAARKSKIAKALL
ncbi:MAG TPA: aminotransferase class V-fold PLP-dependent enzyme [Terriglobia bacterium]|nr:aminotransferase class V-fold PLP-dependent enzyme [Terriglobia bacterium]